MNFSKVVRTLLLPGTKVWNGIAPYYSRGFAVLLVQGFLW